MPAASPSPEGGAWSRSGIRRQLLNPLYIGKRVFRGEVVGDGDWPPLVAEDLYWACVRLLRDPARTTTRPGRAVHLLSYLVRCEVCGGPLSTSSGTRRGHPVREYACLRKRCASAKADVLDEYVQRVIVAWLSRPEVFESLSADPGADADVAHARAEAQRLRAELETYHRLAETGQITALEYVRFSRGLTDQITGHETRAAHAAIPPVLRGRTGGAALARIHR